MRSRTALPFAVAAVTTNVTVAGSPALGGDVGGVMTSVGADAMSMTICAVDVPVGVGVVGVVPVPVLGVVVDPP